jgi:hypothetical protein
MTLHSRNTAPKLNAPEPQNLFGLVDRMNDSDGKAQFAQAILAILLRVGQPAIITLNFQEPSLAALGFLTKDRNVRPAGTTPSALKMPASLFERSPPLAACMTSQVFGSTVRR